MATRDGQLGFWAKRSENAAPEFIAVPNDYKGGVEAAKTDWQKRSNTEWVGEDPQSFYYDSAVGNVKKFTPAVNDPVEETYFDEMLRSVEDDATRARGIARQSYDTFIKHLKEDRALFDEDLGRQYGKQLQQQNQGTYNRGLANSGIRNEAFRDTTQDRDFSTKQRETFDKQKEEIKTQDLNNQFAQIAATERQNRQSLDRAKASPYAKFSFI